MSRKKQTVRTHRNKRRKSTGQSNDQMRRKNKTIFHEVCNWIVPKDELFTEDTFHGNIKWVPEELVTQALIWSWQKEKNVTDAFDQTLELCESLGVNCIAKTYPQFHECLGSLRDAFHDTATREVSIIGPRGQRTVLEVR